MRFFLIAILTCPLIIFLILRSAFHFCSSDCVIFSDGVTIVWPGGDTKVPAGLPDCGWEDELCQANNSKLASETVSHP